MPVTLYATDRDELYQSDWKDVVGPFGKCMIH